MLPSKISCTQCVSVCGEKDSLVQRDIFLFSKVPVSIHDVDKIPKFNYEDYGEEKKTSKMLSGDWSVCLGLRGVIGRVAN